MSSTLPLTELIQGCENIYEAIVIIAKRAQQINEEQKRIIEVEIIMDDSIDSYEEEEEIEEVSEVERKIIKLPKPTEMAIQEMLLGNIQWDYGTEKNLEERDN
ncbi:MAG TPA: DNA-directed RNA polymerase subunit omega [bacterium]